MGPRVFVVVLNYLHHQDTRNCLRALQASDLPPHTNFVVVDNSPKGQDYKLIKEETAKVHLIKSPRNLGFAGGNNLGIKHALKNKATHILIINPDVQVPKNFFTPLLHIFRQKPRTGLVAPVTKHYQNNKPFYGLEGKLDWHTTKARHVNATELNLKSVRSAEFVTFACVLIKTEVFHRIGLLDEGYFMYLEDVDYCLTARNAGFEIYLDPKVVVAHQTSSSFKKPTDKLILSFRSQLHFINKWLKFPRNIIPIIYMSLFYPYLYFLWSYQGFKRRHYP